MIRILQRFTLKELLKDVPKKRIPFLANALRMHMVVNRCGEVGRPLANGLARAGVG